MLCNVADVPDLCNFILPAVHREGPIAVAVSTGGASPALAKRLRTQIAELVGPEHAELAEELRALRPEVKERFATYEERRDYFEDARHGAALVTVCLVGAGPGDPGLITARGLDLVRTLRRARLRRARRAGARRRGARGRAADLARARSSRAS